MKKIIGIMLVSLFMLTGCFLDKATETNVDTTDVQTYKIGEKFKFQTFEITVGTPTLVQVPEMYSSFVENDIIKIPLNIKNVGKTHGRLYDKFYDVMDYNDKLLTDSSFYFNDSITMADDIQVNETIDRNLYFEYTGEDHYKIVFKSNFQFYTIELPISK